MFYSMLLAKYPSLKNKDLKSINQEFPEIATSDRLINLLEASLVVLRNCKTGYTSSISYEEYDRFKCGDCVGPLPKAEFVGLLFQDHILFDDIMGVILNSKMPCVAIVNLLSGMNQLFNAGILNKETFTKFIAVINEGNERSITVTFRGFLKANHLTLSQFQNLITAPTLRNWYERILMNLDSCHLLTKDVLERVTYRIERHSEEKNNKIILILEKLGWIRSLTNERCFAILENPNDIEFQIAFNNKIIHLARAISINLNEFYANDDPFQLQETMFQLVSASTEPDLQYMNFLLEGLLRVQPYDREIRGSIKSCPVFTRAVKTFFNKPVNCESVSNTVSKYDYDFPTSVFIVALRYPSLCPKLHSELRDEYQRNNPRSIIENGILWRTRFSGNVIIPVLEKINSHINNIRQSLKDLIIIALSPSGVKVFGNVGYFIIASIFSWVTEELGRKEIFLLSNRYHDQVRTSIHNMQVRIKGHESIADENNANASTSSLSSSSYIK